jgi:hypothetical protein
VVLPIVFPTISFRVIVGDEPYTRIPAPIFAGAAGWSLPPFVFVMWIPSMRLVVPAAEGKYTAEQFGSAPIVQKSVVGHGFPVASSVVTAGRRSR